MIVLDTHAWIWWQAAPEKLSARARTAIENASRIDVCTISCWELAMLVVRGRITLDREVRDWIGQALSSDPRIRSVVLTAQLAVAAGQLEGFPGDPADRFIYATARASDATLVTKDRALRAFDRRRTLW